jgi:hypothetical protein
LELDVEASMAKQFSESELSERRPVWQALSELYLDTDTTLLEDAIVANLAVSPYGIRELEEILIHEVRPVCIWNAFAWEWIGFDPEWLEGQIIKKLRSPFRYFYRASSPITRIAMRLSKQWARICKGIEEVRSSAAKNNEVESKT